MNVIIPIDIYQRELMLSVGETNDELTAALSSFGIDGDGPWHFENDSVDARTVLMPNKALLIRLRAKPETGRQFGTLAHEIFHCASFILHGLNIPLKHLTEEVWAYLIGHITCLVSNELFSE